MLDRVRKLPALLVAATAMLMILGTASNVATGSPILQTPTQCQGAAGRDDHACRCAQGLGEQIDNISPPACYDHVTWTLTSDTNGCCDKPEEGCYEEANCQGVVLVGAYAKTGQTCSFSVYRGSTLICSQTTNFLNCIVRFTDANGHSLSCGTQETVTLKIGAAGISLRPFVCSDCPG